MNTKQQLATGFLAVVIMGTIALMPVNAEVKNSQVAVAPASGNMVAVATSVNSAEIPQEQVKDLTYN